MQRFQIHITCRCEVNLFECPGSRLMSTFKHKTPTIPFRFPSMSYCVADLIEGSRGDGVGCGWSLQIGKLRLSLKPGSQPIAAGRGRWGRPAFRRSCPCRCGAVHGSWSRGTGISDVHAPPDAVLCVRRWQAQTSKGSMDGTSMFHPSSPWRSAPASVVHTGLDGWHFHVLPPQLPRGA